MAPSLLVTLADGNYVEQAKQLFSSVFWNAGWKGDYLLLACDVPERELRWFRDKGILVKECEPPLRSSETRVGHAPLTTLCKFYKYWRRKIVSYSWSRVSNLRMRTEALLKESSK